LPAFVVFPGAPFPSSRHLYRANLHKPHCPPVTGTFVPFTIAAECSTDKTMEKNSGLAPDGELVEVPEKIEYDLLDFLSVKRIKAGITEIFLGLIAFAAVIAFCWSR
jgi:hypothetical protein